MSIPARAQRLAKTHGGRLHHLQDAIPCEHADCTEEAIPHGARYSFIVGLSYLSRARGFSHRACQEWEGQTQHYTCSLAHAIAAAHHCLDAHLAFDAAAPQGPSPYPSWPLVRCAISSCPRLLSDEGWRYTIDFAMRGAPHLWPLSCREEHWCCSLEHARLAATTCLDAHHVTPHMHDVSQAEETQT